MAITDFNPNPNEIVYLRFTRGELEAAFNAVRNPENWKMAIKAEVKLEYVSTVQAAVAFFAGGGAKITKYNEITGMATVEAPGYYALIGA